MMMMMNQQIVAILMDYEMNLVGLMVMMGMKLQWQMMMRRMMRRRRRLSSLTKRRKKSMMIG
jgi:hypothetical protein